MAVEITNIKNLLGLKGTSEDAMITEHLADSQSKFKDFSDTMIKYYACYLVSVTIKSASRIQKDDDVTYFKVDVSHWLNLAETQLDEELAEKDDASSYALINLANVRVD